MGFNITVQNDGDDGTVHVSERINLNERQEVFADVLASGESRGVPCFGTPPKSFDWVHGATGLSGGPVELGENDLLRVSS